MEKAKDMQKAMRADGFAAILAIGTTNPPNIIKQSDFPDFYFRATNSESLVELKEKLQRICDKTAIRKRHFLWDEEFLKENPCMVTSTEPSLSLRQKIAVSEMPKLAAKAAMKAIEEWGQPKTSITHLIFCTTTGIDLPGADFRLIKILELNPSIQRVMLYHQGCSAGGAVLRLAKVLAESNKNARILIVCAETTTMLIREPLVERQGDLVCQAIFGDGASAIIVGANPNLKANERPIFSIISTSQVILPDSEEGICIGLGEGGLNVRLHRDVPLMVSKHIGECLEEAFAPLNISDWNSIFWACHPGGRAIFDRVEERLGLKEEKLLASRHVLSEYGNMASVCVHFVLDEVRNRSAKEGKNTTGEGFEWGVLFGIGPGLTIETLVLQSCLLA